MGLSAEAVTEKQKKKEEKEKKKQAKEMKEVVKKQKEEEKQKKVPPCLTSYLLACTYYILSTDIAARAEGPECQQSVTEAQGIRVTGDCGLSHFPFVFCEILLYKFKGEN